MFVNEGVLRLTLIGLVGGGFAGFKLSKKYNVNPTISVVGGAIVGTFVLLKLDDKIMKDRLSNMLYKHEQSRQTSIQSSVQPTPTM